MYITTYYLNSTTQQGTTLLFMEKIIYLVLRIFSKNENSWLIAFASTRPILRSFEIFHVYFIWQQGASAGTSDCSQKTERHHSSSGPTQQGIRQRQPPDYDLTKATSHKTTNITAACVWRAKEKVVENPSKVAQAGKHYWKNNSTLFPSSLSPKRCHVGEKRV